MTTMTKPDHSAKNGQLEVLDRKESALEGGGRGLGQNKPLQPLH